MCREPLALMGLPVFSPDQLEMAGLVFMGVWGEAAAWAALVAQQAQPQLGLMQVAGARLLLPWPIT